MSYDPTETFQIFKLTHGCMCSQKQQFTRTKKTFSVCICLLPLMSVRNSSCLTLLLCMSIFSVISKVKRNLWSSYRPRAAYL